MKCYAYTDESGNSGLKLFGDAQDTFWTGTMISFSDLDQRYAWWRANRGAVTEPIRLPGGGNGVWTWGWNGIAAGELRASWAELAGSARDCSADYRDGDEG